MKKIFKGLSAIAVATAIGLNALSVQAATTCGENEVEYTNYYMFLNVETVKYIQDGIAATSAGTYFNAYHSAEKANDIPIGKIISQGTIGITDGTNSTNAGSSSMSKWSVDHFWKTYHRTFYKKNTDFVYHDTGENASYFYHDKWSQCQDENFSNCTDRYHATEEIYKSLENYLNSNISSIATSPLVTKGTSLAATTVTPPSSLGQSDQKNLTWQIKRVFQSSDVAEGKGIDLGSGVQIWTPEVYYVKYCKAGTPLPPPVTEYNKKITYDANTTDKVTNMPSPNPYSFKTKCDKISNKTPERDNYDFLGWSTSKTAKTGDPKYAKNADYCEDKDNITLYAVWKEIEKNPDGSYTVTYDGNDSSAKNVPNPQSANNGSKLIITSNKPTLVKNNFLGWSRDPKAKEPDPRYKAGSEYDGSAGNITLYAVWQLQTGIGAHFIAFSLVAIAAASALVVAKKKDLFKQI